MLKITIHDVGYSSCACVTCPNGRRVLIDCGDSESWAPAIHYFGQQIDSLIISNLDEDHLSGLHLLLSLAEVKSAVSNDTVGASELQVIKGGLSEMAIGVRTAHGLLANHGPGISRHCGSVEHYGGVRFGFYRNRYGWTLNGYPIVESNDLSLATFVQYGPFKMLFPGDLEKRGWARLLHCQDFRAELQGTTVVLAGHHGRDNGRNEDVFSCFSPDIFVISDGEIQYDSQLTQSWYARRANGIPVYSSDSPLFPEDFRKIYTTRSDGTITITVEPSGRYWVRPHQSSSTTMPRSGLLR